MKLALAVSVAFLFYLPEAIWAQIPGDNCGNAIIVFDGVNPGAPTGSSGMVFNSASATDSSVSGCSACKDLWFRYTATSTGPFVISTCTPPGFAPASWNGLGPSLCVYSGACSSPTTLVSTSSSIGGCNETAVSLTNGTIYFIRVGGFPLPTCSTGTFYLTISRTGNNAGANALPLAPNGVYVLGTTTGSTADGGTSCGSVGHDVWYSVVVPASVGSATLSVDTCGSAINTVVTLFAGVWGSIAQIACNNNGASTIRVGSHG